MLFKKKRVHAGRAKVEQFFSCDENQPVSESPAGLVICYTKGWSSLGQRSIGVIYNPLSLHLFTRVYKRGVVRDAGLMCAYSVVLGFPRVSTSISAGAVADPRGYRISPRCPPFLEPPASMLNSSYSPHQSLRCAALAARRARATTAAPDVHSTHTLDDSTHTHVSLLPSTHPMVARRAIRSPPCSLAQHALAAPHAFAPSSNEVHRDYTRVSHYYFINNTNNKTVYSLLRLLLNCQYSRVSRPLISRSIIRKIIQYLLKNIIVARGETSRG